MTEASKGQRHDRSALILYGSETGNSQDVAEELGRVAERLHFATRVSEMDLVEIVSHVISPIPRSSIHGLNKSESALKIHRRRLRNLNNGPG